ncbi:MurR/RpiR family transcriptional regulator [Pseudonocardia xinjiangensis]|uniref:MurR/RpiR family transcriptional regulator n=1 Tax=Pseudonocardia xinjiangensis TaxID=75289 RepID=A0ABX1RIE2_9PSEU|nr:MurR/RpiR family transcriptional regulator [Pseudonocardia xinjiangensis]NMH79762.1 MurR/RpiR family transcriptional regulator [Pseudonocardia xinjiangensis]
MTDLAARIRAVLPELSPAETKVATRLGADPGAAAQLTITELARETATSTATVARIARRLGYPGYPALRLALAALDSRHGAGLPLDSGVADDDPMPTVLRKLASFESEQLAGTAELVDGDALEAVVAAMAGSRRIDVYGIGASGLVAQDLAVKLGRIGVLCLARPEHDAAMVSAALLRRGDVAIGISHSGETAGVVRPLQAARSAGAVTVAVTGASRSALARAADHTLLTAGREFGFRSAAMGSRTSQLLVVDTVFVGVAYRTPGALAALERTHRAVSGGVGRPPRERAEPRDGAGAGPDRSDVDGQPWT